MYERIATLIERLHEKTNAKAIGWKRNAKDSFEASFPNYTVDLSEPSDSTYVWLTIFNEEGDILDALSSKQLQSDGFITHASMLRELYNMARRVALGSDDAIESLISVLED